MKTTDLHTLASFLKEWLVLANTNDPRKTPPVYLRGEVHLATEATPQRQSGFILDNTINRGKSMEVYKITACGSTYIASIGVSEPDDEGRLGLDINLRNEQLFNSTDAIRLLGAYKIAVENAPARVNLAPTIDFETGLSGEVLFEEELLIVAKRIKDILSPLILPGRVSVKWDFESPPYTLAVHWTDDSWEFALREHVVTPQTEESKPLALFGTNPHGKLRKEPFGTADLSRGRLIEVLHDFIDPMRERMLEEHPSLRAHRLLP